MEIGRWEVYWGVPQNQNAELGSRIGQKENLGADEFSSKTPEEMALRVVLGGDEGPGLSHPFTD